MLKFLIIPYILIEILVTWIFVSIFGGFAFKVEVLVSVIIGIFTLIKFGNFRQIDGNFFYFDAIFTKFGLLLLMTAAHFKAEFMARSSITPDLRSFLAKL